MYNYVTYITVFYKLHFYTYICCDEPILFSTSFWIWISCKWNVAWSRHLL